MATYQIDSIVDMLSRNLLSADEFQMLFRKLSSSDRMTLLEKLDRAAESASARRN